MVGRREVRWLVWIFGGRHFGFSRPRDHEVKDRIWRGEEGNLVAGANWNAEIALDRLAASPLAVAVNVDARGRKEDTQTREHMQKESERERER